MKTLNYKLSIISSGTAILERIALSKIWLGTRLGSQFGGITRRREHALMCMLVRNPQEVEEYLTYKTKIRRDGIPGILLTVAPTIADYLARIYDDCLMIVYFPVKWKEGLYYSQYSARDLNI